MFKIIGETIYCTRGDCGNINFTCQNDDESDYVFDVGQVIKLKVYDKKNVSHVVLEKTVEVVESSTSVIIPLTTEDTKIGELINKPTTYYYEISIDDCKTVIGYDESGGKEFILYPEGGD